MRGSKNRNLTEGPISRQLFQLTWPMLFGMMGMVVFNLVDTYFVGKLGVKQLAAMSLSFPVIMFINHLTQGVGIGTSSLISRNFITQSHEHVRMMASRSILLGLIIVIVFVSLGLGSVRSTFIALGADADTLGYVIDYMQTWYIGVPFVVIPMIGNNIIRATGDTFLPGMLMVMSAVINIILDPLLIFGIGPFPEMGIRGAAMSTVIARGVGAIVTLYILVVREKLLTFRFGKIKAILSTWKEVIYIAGPAALAMLITPISLGLITRLVAGYGKEAVAAFGVASRIEMFVLMTIVSLGSVLIIFVGQNFSKNKYQRILQAHRLAGKFSMLWGIFTYLLFIFLREPIAGLFTNAQEVIQISGSYLLIFGAAYGFQGLLMLSSSAFNGINKPYPSALLSLIRMAGLYVPLAWLGSLWFGLTGIFWAGFIANLLSGLAAFGFFRRTLSKFKEKRLAYKTA